MSRPLREVLLVAAVGFAASATPSAGGSAATVPLFLVPGVADSATIATVAHCSNLSTQTVTVWFEMAGATGTGLCGIGASVASGRTVTLASRDTLVFVESNACKFGAPTPAGLLRIGADAPARIVCTVQRVDPAHATPLSLERLSLFDGQGNPKSSWIFEDDFESASTARWSSVTP